MHVVATKETWEGEKRAALIPASIEKLVADGFEVSVESTIGTAAGFRDSEYEQAGATVLPDRTSALDRANIVLAVRRPDEDTITQFPADCLLMSLLDPFKEPELIKRLAEQRVSAISLEMIPRSTIAQKMDVLSSQASLAGYAAMVLACYNLNQIFPMMMTPAGTLSPARVFVIGAGVAGLQAIATAQRLGARVEAFDTRPVVKEEVQSLGAKFLDIDLGDTGQTEQGYAKELTAEQLEIQRRGMADAIARSDIVVTTAQVFGRSAPRIVSRDMIESMRPRSVVVDMAVDSGGNVEGSELGKTIDINGVQLIGPRNLPSTVATHASQMLSSNLYEFIKHFKNDDEPILNLDPSDPIIERCLVTQGGNVLLDNGSES